MRKKLYMLLFTALASASAWAAAPVVRGTVVDAQTGADRKSVV